MELEVTLKNGNKYALVEYYDCENEYGDNEFGVEVWELDKKGLEIGVLYSVPGASFLDITDPDADEYNSKEIAFIEEIGIQLGKF